MQKKILVAALVAPMVAMAPVSAWAHYCARHYHHHHHARNVTNHTYGSSQSMQKKRWDNQGSGAQDLKQAPSGAADQGTSGSTSSGSRRQGM